MSIAIVGELEPIGTSVSVEAVNDPLPTAALTLIATTDCEALSLI